MTRVRNRMRQVESREHSEDRFVGSLARGDSPLQAGVIYDRAILNAGPHLVPICETFRHFGGSFCRYSEGRPFRWSKEVGIDRKLFDITNFREKPAKHSVFLYNIWLVPPVPASKNVLALSGNSRESEESC